jgi:hypothetical protein
MTWSRIQSLLVRSFTPAMVWTVLYSQWVWEVEQQPAIQTKQNARAILVTFFIILMPASMPNSRQRSSVFHDLVTSHFKTTTVFSSSQVSGRKQGLFNFFITRNREAEIDTPTVIGSGDLSATHIKPPAGPSTSSQTDTPVQAAYGPKNVPKTVFTRASKHSIQCRRRPEQ